MMKSKKLLTLSRSTPAIAVVIVLHLGKFCLVDRERVKETLLSLVNNPYSVGLPSFIG